MITEYLLLLILLLLAEIVKKLRSQQRPLALAGAGIMPPWQAWEMIRARTMIDNLSN